MNSSYYSCLQKQTRIKESFIISGSSEDKYKKIIELGKLLPAMDDIHKTETNIVQGCQSTLYLHTWQENGIVYFNAHSEALISAGLAALLVSTYNGEPPEVVLKCPPSFIKELGIDIALTPGRSNGLASMYLRMQQEALKILSNLH